MNSLINITKPVKLQPDFERPNGEAVRLEHLPKSSKTEAKVHCTLAGLAPGVGNELSKQSGVKQGAVGAARGRVHCTLTGVAPAVGSELDKQEQEAIRAARSSLTAKASNQPAQPTLPENTKAKIYLSQLGMDYYDDETCSLRSKSLKLKSKRGQQVQVCHNVSDYDNWLVTLH